jgi:hypothetical protein
VQLFCWAVYSTGFGLCFTISTVPSAQVPGRRRGFVVALAIGGGDIVLGERAPMADAGCFVHPALDARNEAFYPRPSAAQNSQAHLWGRRPNPDRPGDAKTSTVTEPVTGLAANFSPTPLMAPPPFGRVVADGPTPNFSSDARSCSACGLDPHLVNSPSPV